MTDLSTLLHDAVADVEPADRLAEIREAVAPTPRRWGWYAAGGGFLAVAAAVTAIALISQGTTPTTNDDPGPLAPPETRAVAVYYVGDTPQGPRLYREFHSLPERSPESALAELMVQPVGLPGEFTKIARVRESTASNTFCTSSDQAPSFVRSSATYLGSPRIRRVAELMFGQIGETITILSPGSSSIWQHSRIACMPPVVTEMRSAAHSVPYSRSV